MHHMGLPVLGKLSAYFGVTKVVYIQLFNENLEQLIKSQQSSALAFMNGTRTSNSGLVIRRWMEMDVHRYVIKWKI